MKLHVNPRWFLLLTIFASGVAGAVTRAPSAGPPSGDTVSPENDLRLGHTHEVEAADPYALEGAPYAHQGSEPAVPGGGCPHGGTEEGYFESPEGSIQVDTELLGEACPFHAEESPGALPAPDDISPDALPGSALAEHSLLLTANSTAIASPEPGAIEAATGGNARRVAELYQARQELTGQLVRVRGRVVKVVEGVMGTNFVHLRDGTEGDVGGAIDLTLTMPVAPSLGETVMVEGKVLVDYDAGTGSVYPVLLEGAYKTEGQ